jgi:hypothetical protein
MAGKEMMSFHDKPDEFCATGAAAAEESAFMVILQQILCTSWAKTGKESGGC